MLTQKNNILKFFKILKKIFYKSLILIFNVCRYSDDKNKKKLYYKPVLGVLKSIPETMIKMNAPMIMIVSLLAVKLAIL